MKVPPHSTRLAAVALLFGAVAALQAQSLTVTSPQNGEVLGRSNQIRFTITNVNNQIRVVATASNNSDTSITFSNEGLFDPNVDRNVSGSLDLNFDEATPSGTYTVRVQVFSGGSSVANSTINNITIDTRTPRFRNVSPSNSSFVNLSVPILADIEEATIDRWRVRVNDRDIPNNTGTTNSVSVLWDTSRIEEDGPQSISIKVDDKARNTNTRTINVTLDRVSPSTTVSSPSGISYRPRSIVPVVIRIADQYDGSVVSTGVVVEMRTIDGQYIGRVARRSARTENQGLTWLGRIRLTNRTPNQFKVVVTARDRAGNLAQRQEVLVTVAGR